jgi:membrane protease YdiL (CAAX protease family)
MQSTNYKLTELFVIFVIVPVSFTLDYPIWAKLSVGVFGFFYILYFLLRVQKHRFKISKGLDWQLFFKQTLIQLLVIVVITTLYVWYADASSLYIVVRQKPLLWVSILFFYSVFSVYPQELIYRTFFFDRYQSLFKNKKLFLMCNAILFSLAHLFFRNALVMILTFIGGLLFGLTYNRTKSTLLVSIEHAIYGCWLFTVGMGEMLGFPS